MASAVTGMMAQGIKDVVTVPIGGSGGGGGGSGVSILMIFIIIIGVIGLILLFFGGTCCMGIILIAVPVPLALVLSTRQHYEIPKTKETKKGGENIGN